MPTSDPITILLAHDQWATGQILDTCTKLTDEQFHRKFEMGPGSLHNTTTHILAAMRTWTHTLAHEEPGPRIDADGKNRPPAELKTILENYSRLFAGESKRLPLDQMVSRTRNGMTHQFARAAVLTHVTTHAMHHRAQCLNMLRQLGVKPLPPSSIAEWTRMADNAG